MCGNGIYFLLVLVAPAHAADKSSLFAVVTVQAQPVAAPLVSAYSPVSHFLSYPVVPDANSAAIMCLHFWKRKLKSGQVHVLMSASTR